MSILWKAFLLVKFHQPERKFSVSLSTSSRGWEVLHLGRWGYWLMWWGRTWGVWLAATCFIWRKCSTWILGLSQWGSSRRCTLGTVFQRWTVGGCPFCRGCWNSTGTWELAMRRWTLSQAWYTHFALLIWLLHKWELDPHTIPTYMIMKNELFCNYYEL